MSAVSDAALKGDAELYNELHGQVSERTREILERRRKTTVKNRGWLVRRLLATADVVGLLLAMLLSEGIVTKTTNAGVISARDEIIALVATLPGWIVVAKLYGLYDRDEERTDHSTADEFVAVFNMITVCTWIFWAVSRVTHVFYPTPLKLIIFWAAAITFVTLARAIARSVARGNVAYLQNAVIVGAGDVGQAIARKLLNHPEYGINLVGFVDGELTESQRDEFGHVALLGDTTRLPALVRLFDIERVIIAFPNESHPETLRLIRDLKELDIQVDIVPRFYELIGWSAAVHTIEGLPLVGLPPFRLSRSSGLLKRTLDLTLAAFALLLLTPAFAVVAFLIRVDSKGPVFFRQERMGSGDKPFRIFKFRSMHADADERKHEVAHLNRHLAPGGDARMFKIQGDPRVTRVGRVLRRFSIDELPQLWNVVRGEMSLVGPRPLILDEHAFVTDWAQRRLELRPGMTGLWQVLGRDDIPFEEMTRLDYVYVTTWSLWSDIRLLGRTIPVLLRDRGAL